MKRSIKLLLVLFLILFLSACEDLEPEPYQPEYVVESVLVANAPLPEIHLFKSSKEDEDFNWGDAMVDDAIIEIHLIDSNGNIEKKYSYQSRSKGKYIAETIDLVKASRVYDILVIIPDDNNHQIRGRTEIPGEISIVSTPKDTIYYQSESLLEVDIMDYNDEDQNSIFMNTYKAGKPYLKNLTPYYASQAEEDTMSTYYNNFNHTQDLVSEISFPKNSDQSITIHFPWKEFPYFGPYSIFIQSIDENLYDHLRTANAQFSGSTPTPGQIYNAIDHIDGGIGLFGSMSVGRVQTYVQKPE
ncbi:DUF4249 family protein [Gracilimonas mengyeensis]|uniref:DUF4249 domain-containing protein n=1 Tax=Gracilimonas mengyeensis TaxID=1302730 RepID=A0A521DWJ3_9BACT|nr:DUF4249 family protein [Gracilimonas mengyeensis]SMO75461.1 protein of unknown function [Gracilimonas mengyeensis]